MKYRFVCFYVSRPLVLDHYLPILFGLLNQSYSSVDYRYILFIPEACLESAFIKFALKSIKVIVITFKSRRFFYQYSLKWHSTRRTIFSTNIISFLVKANSFLNASHFKIICSRHDFFKLRTKSTNKFFFELLPTLETSFPHDMLPSSVFETYNTDFLYINSQRQKDLLKSGGYSDAFVMGYPKFSPNFKDLVTCFAETAELPSEYFLILTRGSRKDDFMNDKTYIDNSTLESIFQSLIPTIRKHYLDIPIIVKPHPDQDLKFLNNLCVDHKLHISFLESIILSSSCISSIVLFSSTVIDSMAFGKRTAQIVYSSDYFLRSYPALANSNTYWGVPLLKNKTEIENYFLSDCPSNIDQSPYCFDQKSFSRLFLGS